MLITGTIELGLIANVTETIIDDGEKHAHAHKDHQENEQAEDEWAEERCCFAELLRVELHQGHFEEHLSRVQQSRTRPEFADEQ